MSVCITFWLTPGVKRLELASLWFTFFCQMLEGLKIHACPTSHGKNTPFYHIPTYQELNKFSKTSINLIYVSDPHITLARSSTADTLLQQTTWHVNKYAWSTHVDIFQWHFNQFCALNLFKTNATIMRRFTRFGTICAI